MFLYCDIVVLFVEYMQYLHKEEDGTLRISAVGFTVFCIMHKYNYCQILWSLFSYAAKRQCASWIGQSACLFLLQRKRKRTDRQWTWEVRRTRFTLKRAAAASWAVAESHGGPSASERQVTHRPSNAFHTETCLKLYRNVVCCTGLQWTCLYLTLLQLRERVGVYRWDTDEEVIAAREICMRDSN